MAINVPNIPDNMRFVVQRRGRILTEITDEDNLNIEILLQRKATNAFAKRPWQTIARRVETLPISEEKIEITFVNMWNAYSIGGIREREVLGVYTSTGKVVATPPAAGEVSD